MKQLVLGLSLVLLASCGGGDDSTEASAGMVVMRADDVQIVSAAEAEQLLSDGQQRAGSASRQESAPTETTLSVTEANRSFQVRLGTALAVFNGCLGEAGFTFVGIPGQSDDPTANEPAYLGALIAFSDPATEATVTAERSFLAELGGDCNLPAGAHAELVDADTSRSGARIRIRGVLAAADGSALQRAEQVSLASEDPGRVLARSLRKLVEAAAPSA